MASKFRLDEQFLNKLLEPFPEIHPGVCEEMVYCVLSGIKEGLMKQSCLQLRGFGSFSVHQYTVRQRQTLNPPKREKRYAVRFKMGKLLRSRLLLPFSLEEQEPFDGDKQL